MTVFLNSLDIDGGVIHRHLSAAPSGSSDSVVAFAQPVEIGITGSTTAMFGFDLDLSDRSGVNATGTLVGAAALSAAQSKFGTNSLRLPDGASSFTLPNDSRYAAGFESGFAVDCQVYVDALGADQVVWSYTRNNQNWIELYISAAGVPTFVWEEGNSIVLTVTGPAITAGAWHHIEFSRNWSGATYQHKVFTDGTGGTQVDLATDMSASLLPSNVFEIGDQSQVTSQSFAGLTGYIGEFRINQNSPHGVTDFTAPANPYGVSGFYLRLPDASVLEVGTPAVGAGSTQVDLSITQAASTMTVVNSGGTDGTIAAADTTNTGAMRLATAAEAEAQTNPGGPAATPPQALANFAVRTKTGAYTLPHYATPDTTVAPAAAITLTPASEAMVYQLSAAMAANMTVNITDTGAADGMQIEVSGPVDATGYVISAGTNLTDSGGSLASLDTTSGAFWFFIIERRGGAWYVKTTGNL